MTIITCSLPVKHPSDRYEGHSCDSTFSGFWQPWPPLFPSLTFAQTRQESNSEGCDFPIIPTLKSSLHASPSQYFLQSLYLPPTARVQNLHISEIKKKVERSGFEAVRSAPPWILNPSWSFTRCTRSFWSSCTSARTLDFYNLDSVYRPVKAHFVQAKSGAGNKRFLLRLETVWPGESGSCLVTSFWKS